MLAMQKKVGENNGQLCFRPPPRVAHASRLDQKQMQLHMQSGMIVFTLCHARFSIIYIARNRVIRAHTWQPFFMRYDS